jgi:hypothetical protein
MIGDPVAAEAATADGNKEPSMMAKTAARNASDRLNDQCSIDDDDTAPPYLPSHLKGSRFDRDALSKGESAGSLLGRFVDIRSRAMCTSLTLLIAETRQRRYGR